MSNGNNDDDFLGADIDDIFDEKFLSDSSKEKKKQNHGDSLNLEDYSIDKNKDIDSAIVEDNDFIEDDLVAEEDIYVLEEDPGVEVVSLKKSKEDLDLLEKQFDSVKNNSQSNTHKDVDNKNLRGDFVLDLEDNSNSGNESATLLDLDDEFVNLAPPKKETNDNNDFGEFVLERNQHEDNDIDMDEAQGLKTPPPIPKDGDEFILESNSADSIEDGVYSSSVNNSKIGSIVSESETDGVNGQTNSDVKFFNSEGNPATAEEILNPKKPALSSHNEEEHEYEPIPPEYNQQQEQTQVNNFNPANKNDKSTNKGMLFVMLILIALAAYFFYPKFSGKDNKVKKDIKKIVKKITLTNKEKLELDRKRKEKLKKKEKINKLFLYAQKCFKEGKLSEAKEICKQAMAVQKTDAIIFLHRQIMEKIDLIENQKKVVGLKQKEDDLYNKAKQQKTIRAFKNYIKTYPEGLYVSSAKEMIAKLIKRNHTNRLKRIITKAQSLKRVTLRSSALNIGKETIKKILKKGKITNNFELQTIEGDRVLIDYSTGLMWMVARYNMKYDKARWWSARHYAGYFNWRLPTTEEVLSLKSVNPSYLKRDSLKNFIIWTSDGDRDSAYQWIYSLFQGKYAAVNTLTEHNLISVRTIE